MNVLLLVDLQEGFVTRGGAWKRPVPVGRLQDPVRRLVRAARHRGVLVVWATHADGGPLHPVFRAVREPSDRTLSHGGGPFRVEGATSLVVAGVATDGAVRQAVIGAEGDVTVVLDAVGAPTGQRQRDGIRSLTTAGAAFASAAEIASRWRVRDDGLGAGDSALLYGVLDADTLDRWLVDTRDEVDWQTMFHRGGPVPRQVAIQGESTNGAEPLYRHPVDAQPPLTAFTPGVQALREAVEVAVGQSFNHVLIQRYADRAANISLHADKTIDVARGTHIVNLSLGATRTLLLQHKQRREDGGFDTSRIDLPHGSVFVLGWETNRAYRHGIRPDRRSATELRPDEATHGGERISLTFRTIATFQTEAGLVGQGARAPTAPAVEDEHQALLEAFGRENLDPAFDWDAWYGTGFDVVNFTTQRT